MIPCDHMPVSDMNGSATRLVVITAPIAAYEDESPFAEETMSGRMS